MSKLKSLSDPIVYPKKEYEYPKSFRVTFMWAGILTTAGFASFGAYAI